MAQNVEDVVKGHRDALTVRRVYGDPYEGDGVTVIPAAKVMGGGGGGSGESPDGQGQGTGSGFGMSAKPTGAYVIRGDKVTWRPAVDANRLIATVLAVVALVVLIAGRKPR
jgi:uncharacterized spore protein YtfJ